MPLFNLTYTNIHIFFDLPYTNISIFYESFTIRKNVPKPRILMSSRKRFSMTAGPVKYSFKYLFATFHDHLSPIYCNFKIVRLSFRFHFFHLTFLSDTKNYTEKQSEL